MAHNTRIRANLAAWAVGTTVTDVEFDAFDQYCFEAINGDQGGTWAPAAAIFLGGSGIRLSSAGNCLEGAGATLTVQTNGAIVFASTADAVWQNGSGLTTGNGTTVDFQAGTVMTVACDPTISGNPSVTGNPTYSGTSLSTFDPGSGILITGGASLTAAATSTVAFNTTPAFNNGAGLTAGALACSGTGHLRKRPYWHTTDTDINKGINDCDHIVVSAAAVFTAPHNCTLSTTGAAAGDEMTVVNLHNTHALNVNGLALKYASGSHFAATFIYNATAGAWWFKSHSPVDP